MSLLALTIRMIISFCFACAKFLLYSSNIMSQSFVERKRRSCSQYLCFKLECYLETCLQACQALYCRLLKRFRSCLITAFFSFPCFNLYFYTDIWTIVLSLLTVLQRLRHKLRLLYCLLIAFSIFCRIRVLLNAKRDFLSPPAYILFCSLDMSSLDRWILPASLRCLSACFCP